MNNVSDLYLVTQFIQRLLLPFSEWPAYKLGIIDENGRVIKKRAALRSGPEKDSWGHFDVLVCNLKKLLAKIPGGSSKLGAVAATLLLLKEENIDPNDVDLLKKQLDSACALVKMDDFTQLIAEDAAGEEIQLGEWIEEQPKECTACGKVSRHKREMVLHKQDHWIHTRTCMQCGQDPRRKHRIKYGKVEENLLEGFRLMMSVNPPEGTGIPHHVIKWHESRANGWCVQVRDRHDNQVGDAEYHYHKVDAERARRQLADHHGISHKTKSLNEEMGAVAVNATGPGKVAGMGTGPDGEPGMGKDAHKKYLQKNKSKKLDTRSLFVRHNIG